VIGKEFVLGKILDSLTSWFQKQKKEKETVREILMSLKLAVNSVVLHMGLSMEHGAINYMKLQTYLPRDIENMFQIVERYKQSLDIDLSNSMIAFVNYLVGYNETINSLTMGMGDVFDEKEKSITESIGEINERIDVLIRTLEV